MTTPRRYPLDALKAKANADTDEQLAACLPCGWCSPCRRGRAHHCEHPGLSDRQIIRKRTTGLTSLEADRYAIAHRLHPATVWPGWDADRDIEPAGDVTTLSDNGPHDGPP